MLVHWIWFAHRPGLNDRDKMALLQHFRDPEDIYFADDGAFDAIGLSEDAKTALREKNLTSAEEILEACDREKLHILTCQDAAYPARLKNIADPPVVLYYKGRLPDFDGSPVIGVVGTRKASAYGLTTAKRMGYQIARCGGIVVSGMAYGIDGMAMSGALTAGAPAVGVLGCGADIVYPVSNRALFRDTEEYGCILSEFAPGTPPAKWTFPKRNRIISGLSCGVLVVEAPEKSGALITAATALEQGREVYAVPGAALSGQSLGCQELVRQGAKPVFAPEDVLEDLAGPLRDFGVQADHLTREAAERRRRAEAEGTGLSRTLFACMPPETDTPPKADPGNGEERPTQGAGDTDTAAPSPAQDTIIPLLREQGPLHVDALGAALGRSPAELAPVLLGLEIMGRIRRLPGARYEAV